MRRVLFRLKTDYGKVLRKEEKRRLQLQSLDEAGAEAPPRTISPECPVCLVDFQVDDPVVPLTCNPEHVFHIECLLNWADHNYTCPICRQAIIQSADEIAFYEMMQQRNQLN